MPKSPSKSFDCQNTFNKFNCLTEWNRLISERVHRSSYRVIANGLNQLRNIEQQSLLNSNQIHINNSNNNSNNN